MIFSENPKNHKKHVRLVLEKLRNDGLYAKLEKSLIHVLPVEFLGYIISKKAYLWIERRYKQLWTMQTQKRYAMFNASFDVQTFTGF